MNIRTGDVRVLAANHHDLRQRVIDDAIREDLCYHLKVFLIVVLSLLEEADDLRALARYFIKGYSNAYGRSKKGLAPDALDLLIKAHPGNVWKLKNILERFTIFTADGLQMGVDDLHLKFRYERIGSVITQLGNGGVRDMLDTYEAGLISMRLNRFR